MAFGGSVGRVEAALAARGLEDRILEVPSSARTAPEAAAAIGCSVAQIAKSLVFRGAHSGSAVLVVASGSNRVDEARLATLLGEAVIRPDAAFVRAATGFAIGGVPPLAHATALRTVLDRDLLALDPIWAAAGAPHAVFRLSAQELLAITGGEVADVKSG